MITTDDRKFTHPDDIQILVEMQELSDKLCQMFGFYPPKVEHKRRPNADGAMGICWPSHHLICIVIRHRDLQRDGGKWWKRPLPKSEIIDTLIHEVCHLRHPGVSHKRGYIPDNAAHRQLQAILRYFAREKGWIS